MDSYDVFKKLSRGCVFKKNKNENNRPKPELEKIEIKQETIDEETKHVTHDDEEPTVTLLSGVTFETKKAKKRKRENSSSNETKKKQTLQIQEEVNHYRNLRKISVVGKEIPDPIRSFSDFPIKPTYVENLRKCGYLEPTPVQVQATPIMLEGRNLLACAPTGSGKTAAFLIPIIEKLKGPQKKGFRALILCPTRELAKQTERECVRLSEGNPYRIHTISKSSKTLTQFNAGSAQKFDILITTPNRLCFLLKQDPPAVSLANIEWLVIDEADKLFESGVRSFREQLDEILAACSSATKKIAMFSATYTPVLAKWCTQHMKRLIRVTVGHRNAATDTVDQELLFVGNEQGKLIALRDLKRNGLTPPVLVFVQSKERAQQLFNELIYDGINVDAIHADRTQQQRDNTVVSFREGKIWVLICTELMARGIDFKGVNLVVNYDFPPSAISYVHRVGRAGRAGRRGKAITFFTLEDTVNLRSIAHVIKESGCEIPDYMLKLNRKNKAERKKLEKSAPKRDDISIKPKNKRLKRILNDKQKKKNENITDKTVIKSNK